MRVSVIGTGYVGLVSGVCLAHKGHDVQCVDIDAAKVDRINGGESPIHEDGLDDLLQGVLGSRFSATTDLEAAIASTELTLVAVGTPFGEDRIDLAQIRSAAEAIGRELAKKDDYHVVVVKSTVVPGTTETVVLPILEKVSGKTAGDDFGVGMNPEFLREGVAVPDFLEPDRIVIGGNDDKALDVMGRLYDVFPGTDVMRTTPSTAEMIKYTANSLLATLISFSNEIGNLSAAVGVDVTDVMKGVHLDHRFSPILDDGTRVRPASLSYLEAGCGFGGSCFPKDVKALAAHARNAGVEAPILNGALEINEQQPGRFIEPVLWSLDRGAKVAVLGAAFKPDTDDVRESPTLRIVPALVQAGMQVTLHDPIALDNAKAELGDDLAYTADLDAALDGADAVVVVTSWKDYADLPSKLAAMSPQPMLADGRRSYSPDVVERYTGVGYPAKG
ncbi:MAG: UDP-glucose dehydrogenase family protein [Acidimicrobiales bacterium]